jgi:thiol-disulfide isomerase/thioredoxin
MNERETRRRRVLHAGVGLGAALWLGRPAFAQDGTKALPRQITWPAQLRLLDGRQLAAADLDARPVVAVFWSITCPFCKAHNVHVEKLQRAAAGSPLLVLGIAIDADTARVREYVRRQGYSFAVTADHAALSTSLEGRRVIPRTYAVEAGSRLVTALAGEMFEEDVMEFMRLAARG